MHITCPLNTHIDDLSMHLLIVHYVRAALYNNTVTYVVVLKGLDCAYIDC